MFTQLKSRDTRVRSSHFEVSWSLSGVAREPAADTLPTTCSPATRISGSVLLVHTHSSTSSGVIDIRVVVTLTCLLLSCCLTHMSLLVLAMLLLPTVLLKPYEVSSLEVDTS